MNSRYFLSPQSGITAYEKKIYELLSMHRFTCCETFITFKNFLMRPVC